MKAFVERFAAALNQFLSRPPSPKDALILSLFTVCITFNPYYLNDRINVFELGLYLPGIQGIQYGLVPYRDFFHLRGPLELYVPVWLMNIFGNHIGTLCFYFFFGNVLCLALLVWIAREFIRSRYMFYLMIPPIIARTYPRVTYMIWGGMRYALGLAAIWCLFKFLRTRHTGWIIATGLISALAALVSIEMGAYAVIAVAVALLAAVVTKTFSKKEFWQATFYFVVAAAGGVLPWVVYSIQQGAFVPYLDCVWTIVTRMQVIIDPHLVSVYPRNFPEAFAAMVNPVSINFKHMTPSFVYILLSGYLIVRWRKARWGVVETILLSLGVYGFIMYNTGFRGLWATQFEMALMPEKLIYFFLIESVVLWVWAKWASGPTWRKGLVCSLVAVLFIVSLATAFARYNKRFWTTRYVASVFTGKHKEELKYKDKSETYARLDLPRAKGIWVPQDQQKDLEQISQFIEKETAPNDAILMLPELGMYHFLFDRPFVGRFPLTTFSWFNEGWFDEYMVDLKQLKAKYAIVQKKLPPDWYTVYWGYAPSKIKHEQMMDFFNAHYEQVAETNATLIYRRK